MKHTLLQEKYPGFIITFTETPMPVANIAMEEWARSIKYRKAA